MRGHTGRASMLSRDGAGWEGPWVLDVCAIFSCLVSFFSCLLIPYPDAMCSTNIQAATRSCGMTMSAETEGVSRRAALGAFLAGAAAIPGDKCV